ncbi:MAG: EAL domain-containing protein [Magnetococcales bacterium]|nr:EAL domain-containing protein [Magnetococcales bacterium]
MEDQATTTPGTSAPTGLFNGRDLKTLERSLLKVDELYQADFHSWRVATYFQRVYSTTHQRGVGFEGFCRAVEPDGTTRPAAAIFSCINDPEDAVQMDRMRLLLHLKNFMASGIDDRWLMTNIHPRLMLGTKEPDVSFLAELLEYTGFPPHQLVIALREHAGNFETVLTRTMDQLKELGCLVLFDDFRAESANLDRLWRLSPDIVKLDHSLIDNALKSGRAKRMLFKLVSLIHASGSLVLMEKIETEEEAFLVMRLEADFVQGRYFGNLEMRATRLSAVDWDGAFRNLAIQSEREIFKEVHHHNLEMGQYTSEFMECAWAVSDDVSLEEASTKLLKLQGVERVYLLDHKGLQVSQNIFPDDKLTHVDVRYKPLWDSYGATWTRRSSFHDAIHNPGVVQFSMPYRSNTSLHMCTTLSMAIRKGSHAYVLCCDVEWKEDKIF